VENGIERKINSEAYNIGYLEASERYRQYFEQQNSEIIRLINDDINRELKYQLACQKLSGTCDFCPAADLGCHGPEDSSCKKRVDWALEKMVKGEMIKE
jgi:hypothetical protein